MTFALSFLAALLVLVAGLGAGAVLRRRSAERQRVRREFLRALGQALARAKGSPDARVIELLVIGLYGMATKGPSNTLMTTMSDLLSASAPGARSAPLLARELGKVGRDLVGEDPTEPPGPSAH